MSQSPEEMFGEVVAYVENARGMLTRGEVVDLKDLDGHVRSVCESIASLSKEQAQEYLPELTYLREMVAELESEIRVQRDVVMGELKGADKVERANKAYAQGNTLNPEKKD